MKELLKIVIWGKLLDISHYLESNPWTKLTVKTVRSMACMQLPLLWLSSYGSSVLIFFMYDLN